MGILKLKRSTNRKQNRRKIDYWKIDWKTQFSLIDLPNSVCHGKPEKISRNKTEKPANYNTTKPNKKLIKTPTHSKEHLTGNEKL